MSNKTIPSKNEEMRKIFSKEYNSIKAMINQIVVLYKFKQTLSNSLIKKLSSINDKELLTYLIFFSNFPKWLIPYIDTKVSKYNPNSKNENTLPIFLFQSQNNNIINEKIILCWFFYLFHSISNRKLNIERSSENSFQKLNEFRYLLKETNNIIIKLYKSGLTHTSFMFDIIEFFIIWIENFNYSYRTSDKNRGVKIFILFDNLFFLLNEISIIILTEKKEKNILSLIKLLIKITNNKKINDAYNINILLNKNIIQNYIQNILDHINHLEITKINKEFIKTLSNFYANFLKFKFNISNLCENFLSNTITAFENLYYFVENQQQIIHDLFIQSFQTELLFNIISLEDHLLTLGHHPPLNESFLFNGYDNFISLKMNNLDLNGKILFFSFNLNNIYNQSEYPLIFFQREVNINSKIIHESIFRFFLKDAKDSQNNNVYSLCVTLPQTKSEFNLMKDSKFEIKPHINYSCCIIFEEKSVKVFLYDNTLSKSSKFINKKSLKMNFNKNDLILNLGFEFSNITKEYQEEHYFSGFMGPVLLLKDFSKELKTKINIDEVIEKILFMKENYGDLVFVSKTNKKELTNFFVNKINVDDQNNKINEILNCFNFKNKKYIFNCCLLLIPNSFKFINHKNENKNYHIPLIADICNEHKNYIIKYLNISLHSLTSSFNQFILNNGFYYICLQFEYFNQVANYYLINKNEKNLMGDFDLMPDILNCINRNILLLGNHNNELNTSMVYKQIFITLFNCILNLNKIKSIINDIFAGLFILSDVYRSNIFCYMDFNQDEFENIITDKDLEKNSKNFSFFAGIFEMLLSKEFFINPDDEGKNYASIKNLFHKLLQTLDSNKNNNLINYYLNSNSNLFNQTLSFGSLLHDLMDNFMLDITINEDCINTLKNNIEDVQKGVIIFYFELLKIFFKDSKNNKDIYQNYFTKLFRFIFGNLRFNFTVVYNYLVMFYDLIKNEYKYLIDEEKINQIYDYMNDIEKFDFKNLIESNKINYELLKEKIINVLICILLEILFTKYELKDNFNQLISFINNKTINKELLRLIKDETDKYFSISFSKTFEEINKNNTNISNYYWNIFEVIISVLRSLLSDNVDYNLDENKSGNESIEKIKKYKIFLIYDIINVIYDLFKKIEQNIINEEYKEKTIFCALNFLKFLDYIIFDHQLKILYTHNLFFTTIKTIFVLCEKLCLTNSNFLINMDEENNCVKSAIEMILDIFIEYTTNISLNYQNKKLSNNTDIEKDLRNLSSMVMDMCILDNKNKKLKEKNKYHFPELVTVFFINDYIKLTTSYKKLLKPDLFNVNITKIIKKNNEFENLNKSDYKRFDYLFLLFFVVKIRLYLKKIDSIIPISEKRFGNESITKYENIKKNLILLLKVIIEDYKKLHTFNKDFCNKINSNDDSIFKKTKQYIDIKLINNSKKILDENEFDDIFINIDNQMQYFNDINILTSGVLINGGVQNKMIRQFSFKKESFKSSKTSSDKNTIDNVSSNNKTTLDESPVDDIEMEKEHNQTQKYYFSRTMIDTSINLKRGNTINDITLKRNQKSKKYKIIPVNPLEKINNDAQCFFKKYDSFYLKNPKKELMNNIFSIYFKNTFYENKMFQVLKNYYLNLYPKAQQSTKNLNYPSKIKHYNNGLEPSLFLKAETKFFISKIFPVTHEYFYNYMIENNLRSKFIILIPKQIQNITILDNNKKDFDINCELISIYHNIYGRLMNSFEGKYMIFSEDKFDFYDKTPRNSDDYFDNIFSITAVNKKPKKKNSQVKNPNAKNIFCNKKKKFSKMILILYDEIEEIIIRRVLLMWQGIEIYLKNGKSYYFNLLHATKCDKIMKIFSENKIGNKITFKSDFEDSINKLQKEWKMDRLDTYEYLLYINKYSSRSFNDSNQYLIFPWLLMDYKKLNEINMNQLEIYKYLTQKNSYKNNINNIENENNISRDKENEDSSINLSSSNTNTNKSTSSGNNNIITTKKSKNNIGCYYLKYYRELNYPVSAQTKDNKETLIKRYVEDCLFKFKYHSGTHYSTSAYVYFYLMRNEPFSKLLVKLQNYYQENPNRMFNGISEVTKTLDTGNDNRELLPEFFCKIEFFINLNCAFFGNRVNGNIVDDIYTINNENKFELSMKYITNLVNFIIEHRKLLNSESIGLNINEWIDNIFGIKQIIKNKEERENSCNVFTKNTYEQKIDLSKKLKKYRDKNYKKNLTPEKIGQMIVEKINLIICFGQTPYQLFKQAHPIKKIEEFLIQEEKKEKEKNNNKIEENSNKFQNNIINIEDNIENEGEDFLMGNDDVESLIINFVRPEKTDTDIQVNSIYFEVNPLINKIFILSKNKEISVIDSKMYNRTGENFYNLKQITKIKLPHFKFFKKINNEYINDYYVYKIKYTFSSFSEEENDDNKLTYYYNKFLDELVKKNLKKEEKSDKNIYFKNYNRFITCRYLDNSFKIFFVYDNENIENSKKKRNKSITKEVKNYEYISYICEDFVTACCTIDVNSFIIGLKNGKLIKASLLEKKNLEINETKIQNKYYIKINRYIQGHKDKINLIEIDQRLGIVITGGDDNYIYIRKLYDFELLTPIKIKKKYIITMAKVSPMNFLYVLCYNKEKENMNTIIFGYTLTGIKFAKSEYAYYNSIDFTKNGNIVTLINKQEIGILNGSSLKNMNISKNDSDYNELTKINNDINGALWMRYDYFVRKTSNNKCRIISYLAKNFKFHSINVDNNKYFD